MSDALVRTMVWHSACNSGMTMLVFKALEQIEGFDPWAVAVSVAEERYQDASV